MRWMASVFHVLTIILFSIDNVIIIYCKILEKLTPKFHQWHPKLIKNHPCTKDIWTIFLEGEIRSSSLSCQGTIARYKGELKYPGVTGKQVHTQVWSLEGCAAKFPRAVYARSVYPPPPAFTHIVLSRVRAEPCVNGRKKFTGGREPGILPAPCG